MPPSSETSQDRLSASGVEPDHQTRSASGFVGTVRADAVAMTSSKALTGIFILLLLAAIQYARQLLLPIVVALLLFFVFMPLHRRLQRAGIPGNVVAAVLVLGLLTGIGVIFVLLSGPIREVTTNLPEIVQQITARMEAARDALLATAQSLRGDTENDVPQLRDPISAEESSDDPAEEDDLLMSTASGALVYLAEAPAMVAQVIFALVLLFFLLSSSDVIYLKILQSFDGFGGKRAALVALREVESKLGGYLGTVTLVNAGLGVSIGLAMWVLGMPVPLLFAVLGFLLNFIPFIGAAMGVVLASGVALLWFDTLPQVLAVGGVYLALTSLEGQLVTPALLARRLQMNTALVVLAIALWAWMWSFMGMVIAVPTLVALRIISEQVPGWRKFANLLSK